MVPPATIAAALPLRNVLRDVPFIIILLSLKLLGKRSPAAFCFLPCGAQAS
jgi:hypothetical protein